MRKIELAILFILAIVGISKGQKCDCTIYPFKPNPPCYDKCTANILATANKDELELIVGLDGDLAKRIVKLDRTGELDSLQNYSKVLTKEDFRILSDKLESLNKLQVEYFQKPESERAKIRIELRYLMYPL